MTHDPVMLAAKIVDRIKEETTVSYNILEARAKELDIPSAIFEQAMTLVHRKKIVETKTKKNDIIYSIKIIKPPAVHTGAEWVTANYPWPGMNGVPAFEMPFPDIDLSHIFLRGEEREQYKAEAKGRLYISKQSYEYHR